MLLEWKNVESLERPAEIDTQLSTQGVFYRKDIIEVETETGTKFQYKEVVLSNDFRFDIEDVEEYKTAIQTKIDAINADLHITKLDFYNAFCVPASITYEVLMAKIAELNMLPQWNFCNHVYFGIIRPFLQALPLGKTEEEIIAIFEKIQEENAFQIAVEGT